MLSVTDPAGVASAAPERKRYATHPRSPAHPEPDRAPAAVVQLVHRERPARAARRDQPHPGLHRQGHGASLQGLRVRRAQVLRAGVPHPRPDLLQAALRWVELLIKETGEIQEQRVYMGDFPFMTERGHVHHQRRRARRRQPARPLAGRLLHRRRGPGHRPRPVQRQGHPQPWRVARVRDGRPRSAVRQGRSQAQARGHQAAACRRLGLSRGRRPDRSNAICCASSSASTPATRATSQATLDKDTTTTRQEALIEVYKKLRPGDPPTGDNAEKLVESLFFNFRRYDLGRVGRYKVNKKLEPGRRPDGHHPAARRADDHQGGHRRHRRPPHRAQQRPGPAGRHRPPRQPPHPRQRRADPERVPRRPAAHGARRPRAHVDPGEPRRRRPTRSSTSARSSRR